MPTHDISAIEQHLEAIGAQRDVAAEAKISTAVVEAVREEAYQQTLNSLLHSGMPSVPDDATDIAVTDGDLTKETLEKRAKQGDPAWHRRSPFERQMAKQKVRYQLEQQKQARDAAKALEAWRNKLNTDRMDFVEVVWAAINAGISLGHASTALAIRGAMQRAGYMLGMQ